MIRKLQIMIKQQSTRNGMVFRATALLIAITLMFLLTSCDSGKSEQGATSGSTPTPTQAAGASYSYPDEPAESLRDALNNAVTKRGLSIEVGEVQIVTFEGMEQAKILLRFANGNMCAITFNLKHTQYSYDYMLDGHDNPSFVMAFKDADNADDLKTILELALQYLSPGMSDAEAHRLAENQDRTISVDGYSQPLDIAGYQVVTRYTNPKTFARTEEFDSSYGVKVTAIKQMWGDINLSDFTELKNKNPRNRRQKRLAWRR
jgi:hypothetical protein